MPLRADKYALMAGKSVYFFYSRKNLLANEKREENYAYEGKEKKRIALLAREKNISMKGHNFI